MSAFGGKADMPFCAANVCFWPKADMRSCTAQSAFRGKADMPLKAVLSALPGVSMPNRRAVQGTEVAFSPLGDLRRMAR